MTETLAVRAARIIEKGPDAITSGTRTVAPSALDSRPLAEYRECRCC